VDCQVIVYQFFWGFLGIEECVSICPLLTIGLFPSLAGIAYEIFLWGKEHHQIAEEKVKQQGQDELLPS
jgi:hypothetical protein